METQKNGSKKVWLVVVLILVFAAAAYILIAKPFGKKTVTVGKTTYPWEANINKLYDSAGQVDPNAKIKALNDELMPIIKGTVKADVKLTESTDKKLKYVARTIIVESDVDNIKKALEEKGFKDVKVSDQFKKITAKKDDKTITMSFSVDTTDKSAIEVTL